MPRPALTLTVTAVAVAALAALRSRSDAPPAPAPKSVLVVEDESRSPLNAAWYAPARSHSHSTGARASNIRSAYTTVGVSNGSDTGEAEAPDTPTVTAKATRPARAPRTTGTADEFLADSLFRRLDEDGDGVLRGREVPAALRAVIGPKGVLTPEAFVPLFLETVEQLRVERIARATPAWFAELDRDGEGRVSRERWERAGRDADEFRRIDTDGDGFVSQAEVVAFVTRPPTAPGTAEPLGTRPPGTGPASAAAPDASTVSGATDSEVKLRSKADTLFDHYVATAASQPAPMRRTAVVSVAGPKKPAAVPAPAPAPAPPPAPAPTPATAPAAKPKPPANPRSTLPEPIPGVGIARWDQRNTGNLAMLEAGIKPDVLFLGDSITDGLGFGSGKPLWDELYAPLTAANFGIGGLTTSNVLWQVETGQVAMAAPKTIVLLIGSNNLGAKQPPGEVFLGVEKIVNTLSAQLPDTEIMLVGILPRGHSNTDPFRVSIPETNRLLADLEGDRVTFIDVGKVFLSPDKSISPAVMPDGAHPSLLGYQLYTREIWPTLTDLLPKK